MSQTTQWWKCTKPLEWWLCRRWPAALVVGCIWVAAGTVCEDRLRSWDSVLPRNWKRFTWFNTWQHMVRLNLIFIYLFCCIFSWFHLIPVGRQRLSSEARSCRKFVALWKVNPWSYLHAHPLFNLALYRWAVCKKINKSEPACPKTHQELPICSGCADLCLFGCVFCYWITDGAS